MIEFDMEKQVQIVKDLIKNKKFKEAYQLLSQMDQDNLYVKGEYDLLEQLYLGLIAHIHEPSILAKLGRVLYRQKKYIDAQKYLIEASKVESEWLPFTYSVLGGMYADLGRMEEAENVLEKSIKASKKYKDIRTEAGTMVRLGKLLTEGGKHKEAEERIRKAIALAGANKWERDLHIWKGHLTQALLNMGDAEQSKEVLEEILPFFKETADIRYLNLFQERLESLQ